MLSPKLDRGTRLLLEAIAAQGYPPLETQTPAQARFIARERGKAIAGVPEEVASVEDRAIPGPAGPIPIRVYTPDAPAPRAALVYFHGGGWVIGDLETHDVPCRAMARRSGATVIAVDYRLAPEHKFPAAVDDCVAATAWVAANAEELGVDRERIAVGGDSAGGNLAAVVSLNARAHGPAIAGQVLVYPATDFSFNTASHREFAEDHYLTRSLMDWFSAQYVRSEQDKKNWMASPLLADDLRGLPPALIITAECDPLCDEGEAYAKRLIDAGVSVTCTRYAGMIHPFFSLSGAIPQGLTAFQQVADWLRLLVAQRDHRIDPSRAAGRNVAGD